MADINSLYLLVHPGYEAIRGSKPIVQLHLAQQRLISEWDLLATSLSEKPDTMLLYVSPLKADAYVQDIPFPIDPVAHHMHADHERRRRYKELLRNRFVPFPDEHFTENKVMAALSDADIHLNTTLSLNSFGEYTSACVARWGEELGRILGIPHHRRTIRTDLSLSYFLADEIGDWRELQIYFANRANKERR